MRNTRFGRIRAPQINADDESVDQSGALNAQPVAICAAGHCALRVVVRNVSFGVSAFLALDSSSLLTLKTDGPGGDLFELPPGISETFVLAPSQRLFLGAAAPGCVITLAENDALPFDVGDERRFAP